MGGSSTQDPEAVRSRAAAPAPEGPLQERLFPQLSLRFLLGMTVLAAAVLWTVRAALVGEQFWASCLLVVLATVAGCFFVYAILFLLAFLIATLTFPVVREILPETRSAASPGHADPPEAASP